MWAGKDALLCVGPFISARRYIYVEHGDACFGPYHPVGGPVPLHRYRQHKKGKREKRADRVVVLAEALQVPRTVLEGHPALASCSVGIGSGVTAPRRAFADPDPYREFAYTGRVTAKLAIAAELGMPLARLTEDERAVSVKSVAAQRDRALLTVREQLRQQSLDARNVIWSILQVEGLRPPKLTSPAFQALVVQSLDDEALAPLLRPLVTVVEHLDSQVAGLDKVIASRAKASIACKRLMTVPGVGPLVALTYAAGVDDPARFSDSRTVGAHFGLTPRRFQSGEMDWSGGISRAGDAGVRRALYQAANVLIHHSRGWCALKSWAVRIAKRRGLGKAKQKSPCLGRARVCR